MTHLPAEARAAARRIGSIPAGVWDNNFTVRAKKPLVARSRAECPRAEAAEPVSARLDLEQRRLGDLDSRPATPHAGRPPARVFSRAARVVGPCSRAWMHASIG